MHIRIILQFNALINFIIIQYLNCLTHVLWVPKKRRQNDTYKHEIVGRIEHAGNITFILVLERHHSKANCFWDGQYEGQKPNGENFNSSDHWDSNPLNTAPGRNCSVPERDRC